MKPILKKQRHQQVVGETHDGRRTLEMLENCKPDFMLIEISMPNPEGLELTRVDKTSHPEVKELTLHSAPLCDARGYGSRG